MTREHNIAFWEIVLKVYANNPALFEILQPKEYRAVEDDEYCCMMEGWVGECLYNKENIS